MKDFYTEIYIEASPSKVWDSFFNPNQFFKAFYHCNIESNFTIGSKIEYVEQKDDERVIHIYGKITEYEEGKLISYIEHPGQNYRENHAELTSRLKASFEAKGNITRLSITNDQFSDNNPMAEEAKQWYLILSNLKSWIETGNLMNIQN